MTEITELDRLDKRELIDEVTRLRASLAAAQEALMIAQSVCGQNNCNCRGALGVKRAVHKALQDA